MRDTIRDFPLAVGAAAALFAAATSWFNGREIAAVRADLTREIAAVREDLMREIAAVRADLTREIAAVRADLTREIAAVREDLAMVQGTLTTTSDTVIAHINAPGLHTSGDVTTPEGR